MSEHGVARWVRVAGIAALLFILLAVLVKLGSTASFDRAIYDAWQPLASPTLDQGFSALTLLGRLDVALGIAILVGLGALLRRRVRAAIALLGIIAVPFVDDALKSAIGHARPPAGTGHDLQLLPSLLPKSAESLSFPSNHAALAAYLAVVIGTVIPRARPVIWVLAAGVMLSRLYLDKHWTSDVLAGALVGTCLAALALAITSARARRGRAR